eukprot:CAMPEP_0181307250 /NCGR_PEP_ID=MMETSP1101-20121128/10767_1 /TAXON_ID=46948 /ORGANISM="Rhodomonas abbreviata, Strain Caron Lab Isolate" /LENGTH=80 /DNA_ID=CAMNT_0023413429 /DNA_START=187 /DNA_END=429 /DNA_ORIENTATION=-
MLSKLLRGLDGFSGDVWTWEPHDADWIYQGGPTGHLHEVYFNQWDDLDTTPVDYHINEAMRDLDNPFTTEQWQLNVNGIY